MLFVMGNVKATINNVFTTITLGLPLAPEINHVAYIQKYSSAYAVGLAISPRRLCIVEYDQVVLRLAKLSNLKRQ